MKDMVLLLQPPIERYERTPLFELLTFSLAMITLMGSLRKRGINAVLCDLSNPFHTEEELWRLIDTLNPKVVGIGGMSCQSESIRHIMSQIREQLPKSKIIAGGIHASLRKEHYFNEFPHCDAICIGDGDLSLPLFAENVFMGKAVCSCTGFKQVANHKIIVQHPVADLDSLPSPAYDAVDIAPFVTAIEAVVKQEGRRPDSMPNLKIPVETSRGCPANCYYCTTSRHRGRRVRYQSAERVFIEIEKLVEIFRCLWDRRLSYIGFEDNDLLCIPNRGLSICRGLKERFGRSIPWVCMARADRLQECAVKLMAASGCISVYVGAECGYPEGLRRIGKPISMSDMVSAVKHCTDNGIGVLTSFMVGLPWETRDEVQRTLEFACKLASLGARPVIYKAVPFPGTPFWSDMEASGRLLPHARDYHLYTHYPLAFKHPHLSECELDEMLDQFGARQNG